ncbi:ERV1/ALR-related protein [Synechococcus sp. MIT S1220]|uniref:ERV1/ALR-related protein n=1 Tax=Synechococcus sp. MIT S1220 TaxID=3082549 RepID=UPI0039AFECAC
MASLDSSSFEQLFSTLKKVPISADVLVKQVQELGGTLTLTELESVLTSNRLQPDALTDQQWRQLMALQIGTIQVKAQEAFNLLDSNKDGVVELSVLRRLLQLFDVSQHTAEALTNELCGDGSDRVNFETFLAYLPNHFSTHPRAYVGAHRPVSVQGPSQSCNHRQSSGSGGEGLSSNAGTSPLQMQIGFFRLIQGAAYRSFRESYSAHSETHLRAYDLPYTIPDFVSFVNAAIDLYLSLGIVESGAEEPFETLRSSVIRAEQELRHRMQYWEEIPHTPAMREAEERLEQELIELNHHHQILGVVLEVLLTSSLQGHQPEQVTQDDLQIHELNRLRQLDDHHEIHADLDLEQSAISGSFHDSWQRVIVDSVDRRFAGSIMPTAYWYDEFMPLLLRASSVLSKDDIDAWDGADQATLHTWFQEREMAGVFSHYGNALQTRFANLPLQTKKMFRRAWELTSHYLNGVQKRREREEFGRESGFLCQYVAFLDLHVGRHDVQASQMRVSFPYYIGPPTWRLMHTCAELIADQPLEQQKDSVQLFRSFFEALATMYPCPYCRFHLNRYVVKNREVNMYPIEYLFLGSDQGSVNLEVSLSDKFDAVIDGASLRLFLWKLHNTVSSSIARSEAWYQKDSGAYYTSRYWPSLDSELERAETLGVELIPRDRVRRIYGVVKQAAHLSVLRDELQQSLHAEDLPQQQTIRNRAVVVIEGVEDAVTQSRFLHESYRYNPTLCDDPPHFTDAEEVLARSGLFTEN